jgi:hypothetical protein
MVAYIVYVYYTYIYIRSHTYSYNWDLVEKQWRHRQHRHEVVADVIFFFCGIVLFTDAHNTRVRNIIRCFCLNEKCMPEVFVLMGISQNRPRIIHI